MNVTMKVKAEGPLFKKSAKKKFDAAVEGALKELVQEGESFLMERLRPRPAGVYLSVTGGEGTSTGNYRRNISTVVRNNYAEINDGGVVYGPWLEGISSRNSSSRFKGYASFRKTRDKLEKNAQKVLRKHAKRLVKRMNHGI